MIADNSRCFRDMARVQSIIANIAGYSRVWINFSEIVERIKILYEQDITAELVN